MLLSKSMENGLLQTLNDVDSNGRGKKRDKKERGTGRKEGQGGRRDGEELGRRDEEREKIKKMKNEKVAKGCIIGLAGPCFRFSPSAARPILESYLYVPLVSRLSVIDFLSPLTLSSQSVSPDQPSQHTRSE